ncbi:MAG: hypothetical protein ABW127_09865 [Candidatus Thiodiazotropha endolucinida]
MANYKYTIPNLSNGISQQSPSQRRASQAEVQENMFSTLFKGLTKRPGSNHVASIMDGINSNVYTHILSKSKSNFKALIIHKGQINIIDKDGSKFPLSITDDDGYIDEDTEASDLKAVTVKDITYILNTKTTVLSGSALSSTRGHEALVNVMAGNYAKKYKIYIDDELIASHETFDAEKPSNARYIATDYIAEKLHSLIQDSRYSVTRYGNVLHIESDSDFKIRTEDGISNSAMVAIKDRVTMRSDLPTEGPSGYTVAVIGTGQKENEGYYVSLDTSNGTVGEWKETIKPGIKTSVSHGTMPHMIKRCDDGTYTYSQCKWDERKSGDSESNPFPSFVDNKINEIFVHRDRLGFITEGSIFLSEVSEHLNIFIPSVRLLLDTNPIDVDTTHPNLAPINHALEHNESLFLFSTDTQYRVSSSDILSPRTISILPATYYKVSKNAAPVAAGNKIFFATNRNEYSSVFAYYPPTELESGFISDETIHIPYYIPKDIETIVTSSNREILICYSKNACNTLFVYKYLSTEGEKVQASWSKWLLGDDAVIEYIDIVDDELYLFLRRNNSLVLEVLTLDENSTTDNLKHDIYLDRKVSQHDCGFLIYDRDTDFTHIEIPYIEHNNLYMVFTKNHSHIKGQVANLIATDKLRRQYGVKGDVTNDEFLIGRRYTSKYTFSPQYLRSDKNKHLVVDTDRKFIIEKFSIYFTSTSTFNIAIEHSNKKFNNYTYTGYEVGSNESLIGEVPLKTDSCKIRIMGLHERVTITLHSDSYLPFCFSSADFSVRLLTNIL